MIPFEPDQQAEILQQHPQIQMQMILDVAPPKQQKDNSIIFYFQDYLLPQLLNSALAGRPSWVYYTEGLKRLKKHDDSSQVSYLHTLRVYLDNNLSVTKTAAEANSPENRI